MYAKYFTVYFCHTIKFYARVAKLILCYIILMLMQLRNDNNVARVKLKKIETSICSTIEIRLSTSFFGLPMLVRLLRRGFHVRNTEIYKICKLRKRIFSAFHSISQPKLAILLILIR